MLAARIHPSSSRLGPTSAGAAARPAAIKRAARYAAHWIPYLVDPSRLATSLGEVREQAAAIGRPPADIAGAVFLWGAVDPAGTASRQWAIERVSAAYGQDFTPLADRYLLFGSPQQVVDRIGQYAAAGADTVVFGPAGQGRRRAEILHTFTDVLRQLRG